MLSRRFDPLIEKESSEELNPKLVINELIVAGDGVVMEGTGLTEPLAVREADAPPPLSEMVSPE